MLDIRKDHVKFWRPQILLLVSNPRSCIPLIDFGNDIKKGGLYVIGNVKLGELENFDEDPCAKELPAWMDLVDNMKVKAFVELTLSSTIKNGIHNLIRLSGLGGMKPNTVMIGFYDSTLPEDLLKNRLFPRRKRRANYGLVSQNSNINFSSNFSSYQFEELRAINDANENRLKQNTFVDIIRDVLKLKKNLCVCRRFNTLKKEALKIKTTPVYIDVWPVRHLCFVLLLN
jgi:potassium/chloride transporter 9